MISVKNISFSYGKEEVLKNISFEANNGDIIAILGNNGVGKSTLIGCINKINKPSSGSIIIDNKNISNMDRIEIAQNIAYVSQKTEMSRITVYDAILLGRIPFMKYGLTSEDYSICDKILKRMDMEKYKLRYINELSGGEAQKVMLARAFVQKPRLLLLDEPTSSLDPKNQYEIMGLIKDMSYENQFAVLIVIHDLNLALRYCNKFILIKDGGLYNYGDISVITEKSLFDIYGIKAELIKRDNKIFTIIE